MANHRVEIVAYLDRATGICSCGGMKAKRRFGPTRTSQARRDIMLHLAESYPGDESVHYPEYQIGPRSALDCPICNDSFPIERNDLQLMSPTTRSVITCSGGHEFDAYYKDNTLFLFYDGEDTYSPFSTSR